MALFGSIGKAVSHVIHNPAFQAVFPVVAVGSLLGQRTIETAAHKLSAYLNPAQTGAQPGAFSGHDQQLQYLQPMPYSAGGGPWDYSIQSPGFSTLPVGQVTQDYYLQQVPSYQTAAPPGWFP